MPKGIPLATPEERQARKNASNARYRARNHATLAAKQKTRARQQRATMTPEKRQASNTHRNAGNRRRYHANLEESRAYVRTKQQERQRAMPPEERAKARPYQRQKAAISRARNRAKIRAKARQKRLDHGEEMREAERQRRKEHPGAGSARKIAWNKAHPEKTRVASQKWKAANPEKAKASSNAWKAAHPDVRYPATERAAVERRRARLVNAPINDVTTAQQQAVIDTADGVCAYCRFYNPACTLCQKHAHKQLSIDHITPP